MVFTCWSLIHFNLPQNSTHRWLSKRNGCGTHSIIVLQIVLGFFSRSILATQTNLSLIVKKLYLHAGVWFTSICHKTQPTNDFQKEMVVEPPQLVSSKLYYVSLQDPSSPLKPTLALSLSNGIYMLEFNSLQTAIKLNPPMTLKKKWLWNPLN